MPLVDDLILVAKTRDEDNAGTDNRHNLTITIDGVDVINLDLPFGLGEGIARGETGLQEEDFLGFSPPSMRMILPTPRSGWVSGVTMPGHLSTSC
jgi:hypothetical protein